tara:strand:- start:8409 stop:9044 length:636 start_codon:yes stop_codon:yes gene_type:complete
MKISGGMKEDGVVYGNTYDKYGSKNPLVRALMSGFDNSLSELVQKAAPTSIHEIGCGEGFWTMQWSQQGIEARGSDFSSEVIEIAKTNADDKNIPQDIFSAKSIYELTPDQDKADLIVCCEVFEHLEFTEQAIQVLKNLIGRHLILSVPREPIWRFMNFARGKYISELGNTPGHIQHWSKTSFTAFVSQHFEIIDIKTPIPWTMLLCKPRS